MNAREGLRRVGLLLGGLGAITGCIASVIVGNDLRETRDGAKRFQALAGTYWRVLREYPDVILKAQAMSARPKVLTDADIAKADQEAHQFSPPLWEIRVPKGYEGWVTVDSAAHQRQSDALRREGIESVTFYEAGKISSIKTTEGATVYAATEPVREYPLLPLFPALGFLLPWGAIQVLAWVGRGFFPAPKNPTT